MVGKDVGYMESNVVGDSYIEDAFLVDKRRLSGLKLEGSLRDYVKKFAMIVGNIWEIDEKEKLNAFLDGLPWEVAQKLQWSGVRSFSEVVLIVRHWPNYHTSVQSQRS